MILRYGNYTGLSGWTQCNHKDSQKSEAVQKEKEDVRYKIRGQRRFYADGVRDGGRDCEPKNPFLEPPVGTSLADTLILLQ